MRLPLVIACTCLPFNLLAQTVSGSHCVVRPAFSLASAGASSEQSGAQTDLKQLPIIVRSGVSEVIADDLARFAGNVDFQQGPRRIYAEHVEFNQKESLFNATGGLTYQDGVVAVSADSLTADLRASEAQLNHAQYWLLGQQVHGSADQLNIQGEHNDLYLTNATFTTCPEDTPDWLLEASKIKIDTQQEWGEIWDAKLRVLDVPIFYVPYMTVPVSDKRKTGFLFPTIQTSSKNGFDLSTPYYWNIAPNFDATLTPQYMSERGLLLKGEGRYLQPYGQGVVYGEYIQSDQLLSDEANRYFVHATHKGRLQNNWRVYATYTQVSDDNYFNDFETPVYSSTTNQINRELQLSYFTRNWDFSARLQHIETLGASNENQPFRVLPEIRFDYRQPQWFKPFDFNFYTELTHFAHQESNYLSATRWHFEPTLTLPYQTPAGSLNSELKLMQTFYQQRDFEDQPEYSRLEESVSRTLPQLRINGRINFIRDSQFGENYTQTLEPQFQYLYIPHRNQQNIGLYDTALLQEDYYGLFRDRRFSGLDRIANANQLTLGISSRFHDAYFQERAQISVGQILYFDDSTVELSNGQGQISRSKSALAAELDLQLAQHWFIGSSVQFDPDSGDTNKSDIQLDYRVSNNQLIQLSHRYVPNLQNNRDGTVIDINQAGVRSAWPVWNDNLYFVGNYYHDLNLERTIEARAGFQYESCCWAVRLGYFYQLNTNYEDGSSDTISPRDEFDRGVSFQFVLKGLGSAGPLGVTDMLDEGLFNYRQPYYLRH